MLQIRSNQVTHFQSASADAFAQRLMEFLQREFPFVSIEIAKRLAIINDLILAAHTWGLYSENQVAVYAIAQWLHGLTLERDHPEVKVLLEDSSYSTAEKAQWLERWVTSHGATEYRFTKFS